MFRYNESDPVLRTLLPGLDQQLHPIIPQSAWQPVSLPITKIRALGDNGLVELYR